MASSTAPIAAIPSPASRDRAPARQQRAEWAYRSTVDLTAGLTRIIKTLLPLIELINRDEDLGGAELHAALDRLFAALARRPLIGQLGTMTAQLRERRWLPNEQSTDELIRFLVDQLHKRSVIALPKEVADEFWRFFDELMNEPELRGLGDVGLEVLRILLTACEPLIAQIINQLKGLKRLNDRKLRDIGASVAVIRGDLAIFQRQIRALRHIRAFYATDPKDFARQAIEAVVAKAFADAALHPLRLDFALTLYLEGRPGLLRRFELALRLTGALARQGIVLRRDYLHLSRSIAAMVGSYNAIYAGVPRSARIRDAIFVAYGFPLLFTWLFAAGQRGRLWQRLAGPRPATSS